jgi:hypothetical protein
MIKRKGGSLPRDRRRSQRRMEMILRNKVILPDPEINRGSSIARCIQIQLEVISMYLNANALVYIFLET